MKDTDLKNLMDEGLSVGNRIADALEKLVNEPLIEVTPAPPQCPHCGRINPEIQINTKGDRGLIADFLLEATCLNCSRQIYAFPQGWTIEGTRSGAVALAERIKNERN